MVKVSVIIPAYNAEKTIEKCLYTLLNQTFDDYELIVINDGSTDSTKSILDNFKENTKLIVINKQNEGMGKARNIGIKEATGEYIIFVDSGDYVDEKLLEEYYNFASTNDLDVVTSMYNKVINNKIVLCPSTKYKIGNIKTSPQILNSIEYVSWAKLYRRKMLIDNNIFFVENKKYEDMPFVCKALLKSKLIGFLNVSYYYYVINKHSETTVMDDRVFDILDILNIIKNDYKKEYYLKDEVDFLIIDKTTNYMLQQRKQKNRKTKKEFINKGYEFLNKNIKNWKNNKYYKKTSFVKRIIKNHKNLLKIYCGFYGSFK